MSALSDERLEFQNRHENKIREINEKIRSWGQLPTDKTFVDPEPFVKVSSDIRAHLKLDGGKIKIHTTSSEGDLEISEEELGDRIGTGLDFLELLSRRLDAFRALMK